MFKIRGCSYHHLQRLLAVRVPQQQSNVELIPCILLHSNAQRLGVLFQDLQDFLHGRPARGKGVRAGDPELEHRAHLVLVARFPDLLVQGIVDRAAFLDVMPGPLGEGHVLVPVIGLSSGDQLQENYPETVDIDLRIYSFRAGVLCQLITKVRTTWKNVGTRDCCSKLKKPHLLLHLHQLS